MAAAAKRKSRILVVFAGDLAAVRDENDTSREDDPYPDQFGSLLADEALVALRKSFSLTYPEETDVEGLQKALSAIRALCKEALMPLDGLLRSLRLKPLLPDGVEVPYAKRRVFLFVFVRRKDADIRVLYEGQKKRLPEIIPHYPADELLFALRKCLSLTFSEAFESPQYARLLSEIRHLVAHALVPFNELLEAIETEPIAMPTRAWPEGDGGEEPDEQEATLPDGGGEP